MLFAQMAITFPYSDGSVSNAAWHILGQRMVKFLLNLTLTLFR